MRVEDIVIGIAEKYNLRLQGSRFVGPCLACGGSDKSDRFSIQMDGGFKCHACKDFKGDIITWLRKVEGMNCPDAIEHVGGYCKSPSTCQNAANCRLGKGEQNRPRSKRPNNRRVPVPQCNNKPVRMVPKIKPTYPKPGWTEYFTNLADKGSANITANKQAMNYLAGRGIDAAAVKRFKLGWLEHPYYPGKGEIGLPVNHGDKPSLWVPEDLLIPFYDREEVLYKVRIRRTPESRDKFLPKRKYQEIRGSGNIPMVIQPSGSLRGAVIIEAELDAMAVAAAHHDVLVVALLTVGGGIHEDLYHQLMQCPIILVSLDADGTAEDAVKAWGNTFRHAKYWPTPKGKDAGEYFGLGGSIHDWIDAGLPSPAIANQKHAAIRPSAQNLQDSASIPARKHHQGDRGGENIVEKDNGVGAIEVELSNGYIIYVTEKKDTEWEKLVNDGKAVFTALELDKLKAACAAMDSEQRIKAAMAAIKVKEMFGGHITSGAELKSEAQDDE